MRRLVYFLCLGVLLAAGSSARAQDARQLARQHFAAGEAKYRAGEFRSAIVEFRAADALMPSAILPFNIGLCHEKLGERDDAARLYREYLMRRPDAPNRADVEARIAALTRPPAPAPAPPPAAAPPPQAAPVPMAPLAPAPSTAAPPAEEGDTGGDEGDDADQGLVDEDEPGAPPPAPARTAQPPVRRYDPFFSNRVPYRRGPEGGYAPAPAPGAPPRASSAPPPMAQRPMAPPPRPYPVAPPPEKPRSRPIYKHWAFWVVVGVGAVVLISAVSDGGNDAPRNGLTLRF